MSTNTSRSQRKEEIRKSTLARRNAISPEERAAASSAICSLLADMDRFLDARGIHVYLSIGSEVDLGELIDIAWKMGKDVGMMRVMADGGSHQYAITPATRFQRIHLGILEPIDAEPFDMDQCDLVLVPMVAGDAECNRLGYGKGYYDQFLTSNPRPAIGVAFDVQIVDALPADDLDVPLDAIYTEQRVIGQT